MIMYVREREYMPLHVGTCRGQGGVRSLGTAVTGDTVVLLGAENQI